MKQGIVESIELLQDKVKALESAVPPAPTPSDDYENATKMTSTGTYNPFSEGSGTPEVLVYSGYKTLFTTSVSEMASRQILFEDSVSNYDLISEGKPVNIELEVSNVPNMTVKLALHGVCIEPRVYRFGACELSVGDYVGGQNVHHIAYGHAEYYRTFNAETDKRRILFTIDNTYTRAESQ